MKILSIISGIVQEVLQGFSLSSSAVYAVDTTLTASNLNGRVRTTTAGLTFTLPALSATTAGDTLSISNLSNGTLSITVNAADTGGIYTPGVEPALTIVLAQKERIILTANGTFWDTLASGINRGKYTLFGTTDVKDTHIIQDPIGGYDSGTDPTSTGAIKIALPVAALTANNMLSLKVEIWEYAAADKPCHLIINGYRTAVGAWSNTSVQIIGSLNTVDYAVRFGNDASTACIWIGEVSSVWSYLRVRLAEVKVSYNAVAINSTSVFDSGWVISTEVLAFDTVSITETANLLVAKPIKMTAMPISANTTLTAEDAGRQIYTIQAAPITITLPASALAGGGLYYSIVNTNNSDVTLAVTDGLIYAFGGDGVTSIILGYGESIEIGVTGTTWLGINENYNRGIVSKGLIPISISTSLTRDAHAGNALYCNSASAITLTLPAHATMVTGVDLISIANINTGNVTVSAPTGNIVGEGLTGPSIVLRKGDSILLVSGGTDYIVVQNGKKGLASKGLVAYAATATLTEANLGRVNYFDHATVAGTLTLPTIANIPLNSVITISNIGVADCTVQRASTDAIFANGFIAVASLVLKTGDSITLCNNSTSWIDAGSATNAPFSSTTKGLVPASGGGTTNFLRADGIWSAAGGGGGADYNSYKGIINIAGAATITNLVAADAGKLVNVRDTNFASGATINLPAASSIATFTPISFNIDPSKAYVTINRAGTDTIEWDTTVGSTFIQIFSKGIYKLVSDGVSKWVLDSSLSISVDAMYLNAGQETERIGYNSSMGRVEIYGSRTYGGGVSIAKAIGLSPIEPFSCIELHPLVGAATAPTVLGGSITAAGTLTAKAIAATNQYTQANLINYLVTTAATTAIASIRTAIASVIFKLQGIKLTTRFAMPTGVIATDRFFCGLMSGVAAPTDVNPSTLLDIIGVGYDAADTNFFFMFNDGTGTATKIDSGLAAPTTNAANLYTFDMTIHGSTGFVDMRLTGDGTTVKLQYSGADVPATNTILSFKMYHSVGGVSSVTGLSVGPTRLITGVVN